MGSKQKEILEQMQLLVSVNLLHTFHPTSTDEPMPLIRHAKPPLIEPGTVLSPSFPSQRPHEVCRRRAWTWLVLHHQRVLSG
jgi:hypothetical protein